MPLTEQRATDFLKTAILYLSNRANKDVSKFHKLLNGLNESLSLNNIKERLKKEDYELPELSDSIRTILGNPEENLDSETITKLPEELKCHSVGMNTLLIRLKSDYRALTKEENRYHVEHNEFQP